MPTPTVGRKPGPWLIELDFAPPSINHSHNRSGHRTQATRFMMDDIAKRTLAAGFGIPHPGRYYSVRVAFTFEDWSSDVDNRLKSLLDGIFGSRADQRIVHVEATKHVDPQRGNLATVLIQEVDGDYWADDAARLRRVVG